MTSSVSYQQIWNYMYSYTQTIMELYTTQTYTHFCPG